MVSNSSGHHFRIIKRIYRAELPAVYFHGTGLLRGLMVGLQCSLVTVYHQVAEDDSCIYSRPAVLSGCEFQLVKGSAALKVARLCT